MKKVQRTFSAGFKREGVRLAQTSGKGECYDNAMMESFFSSLETECVYQHAYQSPSEAKQSIFEWIEVFYNRQRHHR